MTIHKDDSKHETIGTRVSGYQGRVKGHASGSDIRQSALRPCEGTLTGHLGVLMSFYSYV